MLHAENEPASGGPMVHEIELTNMMSPHASG